ncbi:MAG: glycosyltransferase family 4 protein, partial [Candidatus Hydrothermarchaeota archaeon]|nr:glycosyltransferase family 4 protein [Candidatus Hydrothermarchaeota archaeon]
MGIQDIKTCSSVNHVIAVSQSVKRDAILKYNVPRDKVTVIPLGVDTSWFKPCNGRSIREKLNISEGEFAFLFIGAAVPWKGIDVLMETAELAQKEKQPFKFVLAGKFMERFKGYVTESKLKNIVFAEDIPDDELPKFYSAMDAYIHPAYYTTASTSITEAMACGLPIVASNLPDISELVQDGYNGFLFSKGNHVELYKSLKKLSENSGSMKKMGDN